MKDVKKQDLTVGSPEVFDAMSFGQAFSMMRLKAGGAGGVFTWRGKKYTTDFDTEDWSPTYPKRKGSGGGAAKPTTSVAKASTDNTPVKGLGGDPYDAPDTNYEVVTSGKSTSAPQTSSGAVVPGVNDFSSSPSQFRSPLSRALSAIGKTETGAAIAGRINSGIAEGKEAFNSIDTYGDVLKTGAIGLGVIGGALGLKKIFSIPKLDKPSDFSVVEKKGSMFIRQPAAPATAPAAAPDRVTTSKSGLSYEGTTPAFAPKPIPSKSGIPYTPSNIGPTRTPIGPTRTPIGPTRAPIGPTRTPIGPAPTKIGPGSSSYTPRRTVATPAGRISVPIDFVSTSSPVGTEVVTEAPKTPRRARAARRAPVKFDAAAFIDTRPLADKVNRESPLRPKPKRKPRGKK